MSKSNSIETIFISYNNLSILEKIDKLCDEAIIVGGNNPNAIPCEIFDFLINNFPSLTELKHYQNSRITNILQEYFDSMTDGEKKLQEFFQKKKSALKKYQLKIRKKLIFLMSYMSMKLKNIEISIKLSKKDY